MTIQTLKSIHIKRFKLNAKYFCETTEIVKCHFPFLNIFFFYVARVQLNFTATSKRNCVAHLYIQYKIQA